jgi:hypothetical protein
LAISMMPYVTRITIIDTITQTNCTNDAYIYIPAVEAALAMSMMHVTRITIIDTITQKNYTYTAYDAYMYLRWRLRCRCP